MRATQDNTEEEIHEKQDEMRTTNAPCSQARLWLGHKGQNKRKWKHKSEKHEPLCEVEHRKTKRKTDTKHDQQKRKRHRQTDTLRADAGKK